MYRRELDAAAIRDPRVRYAYRRCRQLNAAHGRTFFLSTRLLAPCRRPAVHAVESAVLLDQDGRPTGTAPEAEVHQRPTPLYPEFSCSRSGG